MVEVKPTDWISVQAPWFVGNRCNVRVAEIIDGQPLAFVPWNTEPEQFDDWEFVGTDEQVQFLVGERA